MDTRTIMLYSIITISIISIILSSKYSDVTYLLYGGIIIFIIYYIITYVINLYPDMLDTLTALTPLSVNKVALMPDRTQSMLLGSSGSTVMGFFNIQQGDRTSTYIDKLQTNKFIPLFQIVNNWYFEISHAPTGRDHISARLRVRTRDSSGIIMDEIIEAPVLPKQKWISIAILRDGRRFDIMYQDKIVASQRLKNYPVVISSPLSVGYKGLDGSVIHMIVAGYRFTPTEVERERLKYTDTNNTVLESNLFAVSFPNLSLFGQCPPGLPCDPITKPPRDNLLQWKTPYA